MGWDFRMRPSFGPFRANISKRGLRSIAVTLGRFTWNLTTGRKTFDSPGPGSFSWGGQHQRRGRSS